MWENSLFPDIIKDFTRSTKVTKHDENWMPITDPRRKLPKPQNVTLLITYANNMFGPSMKVKTSKGSIKFEPLSINNTTYLGRAMKLARPFQEQRAKRGVLHLYNMVSCATGCNPLIYKGYGYVAKCMTGAMTLQNVRCFLNISSHIFWKCYYSRPLCALDHGEFGGPGSCASRLCECDRILSECLSHYPCPASRALCRSSPLRLLQNALMIFR
ncbi:hypothetical protein NQ314_011866 [Rhamnusium bicolor]|uniref:Phospholipase A(2) n=1 Tax=Rhamnusium bicolor TaxID=1586634 RepID=A0AAV8XEV6_9CUCU|nr:hypothetical protein NQ314_011866 [Rhamnusium bicolor]